MLAVGADEIDAGEMMTTRRGEQTIAAEHEGLRKVSIACRTVDPSQDLTSPSHARFGGECGGE